MSAGSLFHTVAAATAKALVPMMVFVRCTNSFMVSVDRKCRLRTVEAKTQLSAKYCGARPWMHLKTVMVTLKSIRCQTGSHLVLCIVAPSGVLVR